MNDQSLIALYRLQNRLLSLKLLPRTGWLQRGIRDPESIAEHSFGVAVLALLVGDAIPHIDRGRLLAIALLHDLAEALTGDLPATARRLFGAEAKYAAERGAMEELLADVPQAASYLDLWDDYVQGASAEARLVKALDRLEMLSQAFAYEQAGSRALDEFWDDADRWSAEFPAVRTLAEFLIAERVRLLERR
jgi:putative hydrolase of HD superfamily